MLDANEIEKLGTMPVRGRSAPVDVFTVAGWGPQTAPAKAI